MIFTLGCLIGGPVYMYGMCKEWRIPVGELSMPARQLNGSAFCTRGVGVLLESYHDGA